MGWGMAISATVAGSVRGSAYSMLRFWIAMRSSPGWSPELARTSSGSSTTPTAEPITASGSW